ncbi:hypothetical protein Q604_UNBC15530G0001, partial [human gut metagenome]
EVLSEQARQLSNRKTNFRIPGYKSELFPGLISKSKKPQLFRFWAGGKTSPPRPPLHAHCVSRETPVLRVTLTDAIPVPASVEPRFY